MLIHFKHLMLVIAVVLSAQSLQIYKVLDPASMCVCVRVVWAATVDEIVPLLETQRTEPTPSAAPSPGSDTPIHTATAIGQLSCRGGAGVCSPVCFCVCTHVCLCSVSFAMFSSLVVLVYFV